MGDDVRPNLWWIWGMENATVFQRLPTGLTIESTMKTVKSAITITTNSNNNNNKTKKYNELHNNNHTTTLRPS